MTYSQTELSPKRQELLDALPIHQWNFVKAGMAIGYKRSYCERRLKKTAMADVLFCEKMNQLRAIISAKSMKGIELAQEKLAVIMLNPETSTMNLLRAIDITCKIAGVYSEKRVFEDIHRTKALEAAEQQEAQLLSTARLRLPAPAYSDTQDVGGDDTDDVTHTAPVIEAETVQQEDVSNGQG